MFTSLTSSALSVSPRPQIFFPEQRVGTEQKSAPVQKPARQIQPNVSKGTVRTTKNTHGDVAQFSSPKVRNEPIEESTPDSDFPTKAFTGLGSSMSNLFGIQV
jgi:hypothetical protein